MQFVNSVICPTKNAARNQLAADIENYLSAGGQITYIDYGITSTEENYDFVSYHQWSESEL